jgi:hypothetical protein
MNTSSIPPDDGFARLAVSVDTFSTLQRAMMRRMLPLQLVLTVMQLVVLVAMVLMYLQNRKLITSTEETKTISQEIADRPAIELRALPSSSTILIVPPSPTGAPSVQLQLK